ncbi:MAG: MBOAT family protein [Acidobacteria bacterium]|nr:MBOAT family protein [Acidobacteriota bacterium]
MVFSSHFFIFYFLPVVLLLNYSLPFRLLSLTLTLLSYAFYGWLNPAWVLLMLLSSYIDYFCGIGLVKFGGLPLGGADLPLLPKDQPRNRWQKLTLAVSMVTNLSIIGFFKYYDFGATTINALARAFGWGSAEIGVLHIALPIGISFYTFQSMSYAIDVYRGEARAMKNPIDFQLFVALFPHQIAGPIIRYRTVAEQIRSRSFSYEKFARGVSFFCLGMAKKIILANPMGDITDAAFTASSLSWFDAWYGLFAYAFQIYFDFSAYSDMAVGLGLMLGFCFMKNFDDPYRAVNITDFWRRWHISLSTWLRDYLYIPLGGNQGSKGRTYANLMTVMLLGGLWHGASWNFVVWGGIHGLMLSLDRIRGRDGFYDRLPTPLRVLITFLVVNISWVFFRAETFGQTLEYLASLFSLSNVEKSTGAVSALLYTPYHVLMFVSCAVTVWFLPQVWDFTQRITPSKAAACLVLFMASVALLWTQSLNPFLYFQF